MGITGLTLSAQMTVQVLVMAFLLSVNLDRVLILNCHTQSSGWETHILGETM